VCERAGGIVLGCWWKCFRVLAGKDVCELADGIGLGSW